MRNKTITKIPFENTDYYKLLHGYSEVLSNYPGNKDRLSQQIESVLEKYREKDVMFSAYHGDFTPWNTFYNSDKTLHVFDFEYAVKTYPPMLDLYHWFVSDCIFRLHLSADEIYKEFRKHITNKYDKNADRNMKLYLIAQIVFYLYRDGNNLAGDVLENMKIWDRLLDYFL
jgi:thiamine kinase-like enzyme